MEWGAWEGLLSVMCGLGSTKAEVLVVKLGSRFQKVAGNGPCGS